jgi:polyvinyl alcohol dehydrogenase (cytochrome)
MNRTVYERARRWWLSGRGPRAAALLVAVTSSAWPMYGHDLSNSRNGGSTGPSVASVGRLTELWRFRSLGGDFTGTPVSSNGEVIAGARNGVVYALALHSGVPTWSDDLHAPINGSAAIDSGIVYVPLATVGAPGIAALRLSDGALLWRTTIGRQRDSDLYGSPVVWHRTVYLGTTASFGEDQDPRVRARGSLVALDAHTGTRKWTTYTVARGFDGGAVATTPAIDTKTGHLFIGTGNAYHAPAADTTDAIIEIDARNGRILGRFQARSGDVNQGSGPGPDLDFEASPNLFLGPKNRPMVGDGDKSGVYWALDRRTMRLVWRTSVATDTIPGLGGIIGSAALDQARIYGPGTRNGETWSLTTSGRPSWTMFGPALGPLAYHLGPVSVANGVTYSTNAAGTLTIRDARSGALLGAPVLGSPSYGGVAIVGSIVIAALGTQSRTNSGEIVAYSVP